MLELKKINLSTGNQQVLTDICVTFEKGKIYGLLGPNGSGKTTLFKTILELTKYTGEIHSLDTEKYGMLIEYPGFYENLTIIENMKLHAKYLHVKESEMTAMADELIFIKDGKIVKSMKNEGLDGEKLEEIYEEVIRGGNNEKFN